MADKTYVYENTEVSLTGRKAQRNLKSGKVDILHEVTPADQSVGGWRKWVEMSSLYEIVEPQVTTPTEELVKLNKRLDNVNTDHWRGGAGGTVV